MGRAYANWFVIHIHLSQDTVLPFWPIQTKRGVCLEVLLTNQAFSIPGAATIFSPFIRGSAFHLVAVAEKQNYLTDFAKLFVKKMRNHTPNFCDFALTGMLAGRNKKGSIPPRKRKFKIPPSLLVHTLMTVEGTSSTSGIHLQL